MAERSRAGPFLRWAVSLSVLGLLLWWLEPAAVAAQIVRLSPHWLAAALAVTVVQTLLSAWRWRFTARRLGLDLSRARALGDYYLAVFVNQVLPGGVLGDALRAHRHSRLSDRAGPAWRAVIIERASGQLVVAAGTVAVVAAMPVWREVLTAAWPGHLGAWALAALGAVLLAAVLMLVARRLQVQWQELYHDVQRSLLAPSAWPQQLGASAAIVFSYVLVFALVARGIGVELEFGLLLAVALPILLAMLIPLSVAGWGFREAAAASVWLALGLSPEQGLAVAIAYGVVTLVGSLPGALVLVLRPTH